MDDTANRHMIRNRTRVLVKWDYDISNVEARRSKKNKSENQKHPALQTQVIVQTPR